MLYNGENLDQNLLKKLNDDELKKVASILRENIVQVVSNNGGHLSSNLGVIELTIGLLKNFDIDKDDIIFDVGHQTYAYKILTGRDLSSLRKKDGIAPFSSREESKYDVINNGHSSTSISYALALAESKRIRGDNSYTIAFTGDGSITNGLSFEALNCIADYKDLNIIIVLNDNGMSISNSTGSLAKRFAKLRKSKFYLKRVLSFKRLKRHKLTKWIYYLFKKMKDGFKHLIIRDNIFEAMGLSYNGAFDGNNIKEVNLAFDFAKQVKGPIILHFVTEKGKGFEFASDDKLGHWHGVDPFDVETGSLKEEKREDYSSYTGKMIHSLMEKDESTYLISPAMVYGSNLEDCFLDFKERTKDVGISEEHAIVYGTGLAIKNHHVILSIYSTFLQRGYDEISHDLARSNVSMLVIIERAGLVGKDGSSHQGIYDVAFLKTIPNVTIYQPSSKEDIDEIYNRSDEIFSLTTPVFIRLPKEAIENVSYEDRIEGNKSIVLSLGPRGKKLLSKVQNVDTLLIKRLHPLEEKLKIILNYERIYLYDPYSTINGISSSIEHYLIQNSYKGIYHSFGLPNDFISSASVEEQLQTYELDEESIINKINDSNK